MRDLDYNKIGLRVKEARKNKGYTQEKLAEIVGISAPHMGHIETANSSVGLRVLIKIANALEVSANDLLYDSLDTCIDTYPKDQQVLKEILDGCTPLEQKPWLDLLEQAKGIFHIG